MIPEILFIPCSTAVDWVAVGAIATFCAVAVALLPIWIEHRRRTAVAEVLRVRLFAELGVLQMSLQAACEHWPAGERLERSTLPFRDVAGKVDALMDQAHLLKPDEYGRLVLAHANLRAVLILHHVSLATARELLADTEAAMGELVRAGGFLQQPAELRGKLRQSPKEPSDRGAGGPK